MNKKITVVSIFLAIYLTVAGSIFGQQLKSWKEWSKKDAEKMLNNSPWAQLQRDMDFAEASPLTRPSREMSNNSRLTQGDGLTYGIRFFSARPVRQAFVRMIQLQQKNLTPDMESRLNAFAEMPSKDSIVIAVTVEAPDANLLGKAMGIIFKASTPILKNTTYLERSDGKRLFIDEYAAPGKDGFGARFIFPRMLDGKPFLNADDTVVRFVSEMDSSIKLHMTYKVKNMLLDGQVEY